jgi:cobalt/nickel transport system ATP-binding protein
VIEDIMFSLQTLGIGKKEAYDKSKEILKTLIKKLNQLVK